MYVADAVGTASDETVFIREKASIIIVIVVVRSNRC